MCTAREDTRDPNDAQALTRSQPSHLCRINRDSRHLSSLPLFGYGRRRAHRLIEGTSSGKPCLHTFGTIMTGLSQLTAETYDVLATDRRYRSSLSETDSLSYGKENRPIESHASSSSPDISISPHPAKRRILEAAVRRPSPFVLSVLASSTLGCLFLPPQTPLLDPFALFGLWTMHISCHV